MNKTYQKVVSFFSLVSLLIVVSGFCYVPTTQAYMGNMHISVPKLSDCHQKSQHTISQKSMPLTDNSVKPCCVDRHDKTSTTLTSDFSGVGKVVLTQDFLNISDNISLNRSISNTSSDISPPKPDKLSSILRLE